MRHVENLFHSHCMIHQHINYFQALMYLTLIYHVSDDKCNMAHRLLITPPIVLSGRSAGDAIHHEVASVALCYINMFVFLV